MAYKNVRDYCECQILILAKQNALKTYSIVAKEGGQSMPDKGNLRSVVKQADGVGHEFPVFSISLMGLNHIQCPQMKQVRSFSVK